MIVDDAARSVMVFNRPIMAERCMTRDGLVRPRFSAAEPDFSKNPRNLRLSRFSFEISQPAVSQHLRELRGPAIQAHSRAAARGVRLVGAVQAVLRSVRSRVGIRSPPRRKEKVNMAVEGSLPQSGVIVPHLVVRDAAEALYRSPPPRGAGEPNTCRSAGVKKMSRRSWPRCVT